MRVMATRAGHGVGFEGMVRMSELIALGFDSEAEAEISGIVLPT